MFDRFLAVYSHRDFRRYTFFKQGILDNPPRYRFLMEQDKGIAGQFTAGQIGTAGKRMTTWSYKNYRFGKDGVYVVFIRQAQRKCAANDIQFPPLEFSEQ